MPACRELGSVSPDGSRRDLRVVASDHPALAEAAPASAARATWEAARMRGNAVEVPVTIRIDFRLQRPGPGNAPGRVVQSIAME